MFQIIYDPMDISDRIKNKKALYREKWCTEFISVNTHVKFYIFCVENYNVGLYVSCIKSWVYRWNKKLYFVNPCQTSEEEKYQCSRVTK